MGETVDTVRLSKILDVSKNTVSKAIAKGRLKKSVRKAGSKYEIDLVTAILEWYQNANLSQDRGDHKKPLLDIKDLMEIEQARRIREHYLALLEKIEYEKQTNVLLDKDKIEKEIFDIFRGTRDRILSVSNKVPEEHQEQILNELTKALEDLSGDSFSFINN